MKRSHVILIVGGAALVGGYFAFPVMFEGWLKPAKHRRIVVHTAPGDTVEIQTSSPKVSVLVGDDGDKISTDMTHRLTAEDNVVVTLSTDEVDPRVGFTYFRKNHGVFTVLNHSDEEGIPTQKAFGAKGEIRNFVLKKIEWSEAESRSPEPNQPLQPTRPSGPRG